ncbi:ATPase involved in DNA replication initiation [Penicillium alfredii]|uniref:ATPase involved in DNA replication initiation n=1 Tax=Penicillium alfredii TaxID=1506179 RepID=A0A9W9ELN6_9EURO|nr:ATPase involved in DNA replication initiation [Penicillium alfredii]KAJ5083995.1 ATPase involved in DNA replication initiation [Penicillium alfredii]
MPPRKIYSAELGLNLDSGREEESFKWFLACLLFGKPIQQDIARRAFHELTDSGITSPTALLDTGWQGLVEILDRAHYVRYDFSTASKLLDVAQGVNDKYGSFGDLLRQAGSTKRLSGSLRELKGVGPKTVDIFLRDMSPALQKSWGYEC